MSIVSVLMAGHGVSTLTHSHMCESSEQENKAFMWKKETFSSI